MSGYTVKFKAVFGQQHSRPARTELAAPAKPDAPPDSRTARALALAHKIDAAIAAGQLRDEAHAAEALGQSRSHISHVMHLLLLAPEIQTGILLGRRVISARQLRAVSRVTLWVDQVATERGARATSWLVRRGLDSYTPNQGGFVGRPRV